LLLYIHCNDTDNCDAADIRELPAALASFQWHQPSQPPHKNVNSAVSPVLPACHFGGLNAKSVTNVHLNGSVNFD